MYMVCMVNRIYGGNEAGTRVVLEFCAHPAETLNLEPLKPIP